MGNRFDTLYLSPSGKVVRISGYKPGALHVQYGDMYCTRFAVYRVKTTCKPLVVEYANGQLVTR